MVMRRLAHRILVLGVLAEVSGVAVACDHDGDRATVATRIGTAGTGAAASPSVSRASRAPRPAASAGEARGETFPRGEAGPAARSRRQAPDTTVLLAMLGCGACHAGLPAPASPATRLTAGGGPRDPAALFTYLADSLPGSDSPRGSRMPDFHLDERESLALALFLGRGRAAGEARRPFEQARRQHDDIGAEDGARLYEAFACGACHGGLDGAADAPPLAIEGARVQPDWLRGFLREPHAVRPFGTTPGSGSRMPDFGLDAAEVDAIAELLLANRIDLPPFEPSPPTPFAAAKMEALLETRLDCLGCHALDGRGGRIAPDLAAAAVRLRPAYIRSMLDDPAAHVPGTIMPRSRLPEQQRDALASYLATRPMNAARAPSYLSPLDHARLASGAATVDGPDASSPVNSPEAAGAGTAVGAGETANIAGPSAGATIYRRRCAVCHGPAGGGDGFNAAFLDARPTAHADSATMAGRPDDTLFDGIAAGGRILGRSARMPAFGASLDPREIRALVAYIRRLCDCTPPAWSTDGAR